MTASGSPFLLVVDLFDQHATTYRNDRVAWLHDCVDFHRGPGPTDYQDRVMAALDEHDRVAVTAPRGGGKTSVAAWAIWHYICTCDVEGADWKVPTTAGQWRQLTYYLWPEIRKWAKLIRWDKVGRRALTRFELLQQSIKLPTGEAFAAASDRPESLEGAHADRLLYVFDESKLIVPATWDATEGAFSNAGPDTPNEAKWLAGSTPGSAFGRLYEIVRHAPGYEDWHVVEVSLDDVLRSGRVSAKHVADRKRQWGEHSQLYINQVLGQFSTVDTAGVIPMEWVELANERWRDIDEMQGWARYHPERVGVDVARGGADKTIFAHRSGNVITRLEQIEYDKNTSVTADKLDAYLAVAGVGATIDATGVGVGVLDPLAVRGRSVFGFVSAAATKRRDKSGVLRFANKRAAAWWHLREMLDPESGENVALPPSDELMGDLTTPRYDYDLRGHIIIEKKEAIKKRIGKTDDTELGRSTDCGDAVVYAFWDEAGTMDATESTSSAYVSNYGLTGDLLTKQW